MGSLALGVGFVGLRKGGEVKKVETGRLEYPRKRLSSSSRPSEKRGDPSISAILQGSDDTDGGDDGLHGYSKGLPDAYFWMEPLLS